MVAENFNPKAKRELKKIDDFLSGVLGHIEAEGTDTTGEMADGILRAGNEARGKIADKFRESLDPDKDQ
jgi:hypothetical protein